MRRLGLRASESLNALNALGEEMFLGNSLDRFSSFVMLSRHRRPELRRSQVRHSARNLRSVNYNGGGVALLLISRTEEPFSEAFLEDGVVQVGVRRVIGPTFRLPIKWIFTVDRRMEGLFPQGEQLMRIKVAIRSLSLATSTPVLAVLQHLRCYYEHQFDAGVCDICRYRLPLGPVASETGCKGDLPSPCRLVLVFQACMTSWSQAWHSLVASWNCADSLMDSFLRIDIPATSPSIL